MSMDTGHYNCRDYDVSPHFAATTITSDIRLPFDRHESYDELVHRSLSPASFKPKFPLLRLPLELRQQIFSYLLPRTQEVNNQTKPSIIPAVDYTVPLETGASPTWAGRSKPFYAIVRTANTEPDGVINNVVWVRGNTSLLAVCRQLHRECAEMLYGRNTFLLFVTYSGISFRFRWLLPSGLAPSRSYPFLELTPERYLQLIRRVVVNVDHVDAYTSMIKFNVSENGLIHGLRKQVQRLVWSLQPSAAREASCHPLELQQQRAGDQRRMTKVLIRVSNGNAVLDSLKTKMNIPRAQGQSQTGIEKVSAAVEDMLQPFGYLAGVREVKLVGAVSDSFAESLESRMRSTEPRNWRRSWCDGGVTSPMAEETVHLNVYGNDIA